MEALIKAVLISLNIDNLISFHPILIILARKCMMFKILYLRYILHQHCFPFKIDLFFVFSMFTMAPLTILCTTMNNTMHSRDYEFSDDSNSNTIYRFKHSLKSAKIHIPSTGLLYLGHIKPKHIFEYAPNGQIIPRICKTSHYENMPIEIY